MTLSLKGAKILKDLSIKDIRVLQMVETLLKRGEYAPFEKIALYSGFREKDVDIMISRLHKFKLLQRWKGHYVGYTLTFAGHDALALNALYNKKAVYGVGREKAVGKESDIYYAIDFEENEVIIKINRTGRPSFQHIRKKRDFLDGKFHYSIFFLAAVSAHREYTILSKLQKSKLSIPKIINYNRHIIVMEPIPGIELVNVKYLKNPTKVLRKTIEFAKKLYKDYHLIHGDLTEYNILYDENGEKITIIDFPQTIPSDHPEAMNFLSRDFEHLFDFFGKKWSISMELESVIDYITKK